MGYDVDAVDRKGIKKKKKQIFLLNMVQFQLLQVCVECANITNANLYPRQRGLAQSQRDLCF